MPQCKPGNPPHEHSSLKEHETVLVGGPVVLLFVFSQNLETVAIDGDTIAFSVMYKQW